MLVLAGCDLKVFNPGAITEESLNDPGLMAVVAAGVANEFNQIFDNFGFDIVRLSDEGAGNGSYFGTNNFRRGQMDWTETAGIWSQLHETIWTGLSAWYRMSSLDDYDQDKTKDAARVWLMIGHAHRMFGENFCQVVYSVGKDFTTPEKGNVQPRTAAFDSAIVSLNRAITIAQAAGASDVVTAARAGIAQAYVGKNDFAKAITWSEQVPTSFSYDAIFNQNSNENEVWGETRGRNEVGLFNSYSYNLAAGPDPRVPFEICGTFANMDDPFNSKVVRTGLCPSENGADGRTAHVRQAKYMDPGSDIPIAKGTEMRLIEAEAALLAGDLAKFTARINAVRAFHGLAAIAQPSKAGDLEYMNSPRSPFKPSLHNAYDATTGNVNATVTDPETGATHEADGWSILDGERHLTMWGEGRRLWDLHRWDHPFLDGGIVFWDAEPRRISCFPVPEDECQLNDVMKGAALSTGFGSATQTCG